MCFPSLWVLQVKYQPLSTGCTINSSVNPKLNFCVPINQARPSLTLQKSGRGSGLIERELTESLAKSSGGCPYCCNCKDREQLTDELSQGCSLVPRPPLFYLWLPPRIHSKSSGKRLRQARVETNIILLHISVTLQCSKHCTTELLLRVGLTCTV